MHYFANNFCFGSALHPSGTHLVGSHLQSRSTSPDDTSASSLDPQAACKLHRGECTPGSLPRALFRHWKTIWLSQACAIGNYYLSSSSRGRSAVTTLEDGEMISFPLQLNGIRSPDHKVLQGTDGTGQLPPFSACLWEHGAGIRARFVWAKAQYSPKEEQCQIRGTSVAFRVSALNSYALLYHTAFSRQVP